MSDNLRTRIAAVAAEHRFADHRTSFGDKCVCGWTSQDVSHADHLADAVIEALTPFLEKEYDGVVAESLGVSA